MEGLRVLKTRGNVAVQCGYRVVFDRCGERQMVTQKRQAGAGPYDHLHGKFVFPQLWVDSHVSLEGALLDNIVLLKGSPQTTGHIAPCTQAWRGQEGSLCPWWITLFWASKTDHLWLSPHLSPNSPTIPKKSHALFGLLGTSSLICKRVFQAGGVLQHLWPFHWLNLRD